MSARDRILNRVDEATRETKDAIAKARAEARAQGKPFDLKKFHADRAEAESEKRDVTKFGRSWKGEGGRPGSQDIRRNVAGSKGRSGRGTKTAEDEAKAEEKREEATKSGLDPKTGQRVAKMTGPQRGGMKRSIKSRLAKGPSKPMNLPDHNESDYTDDEVIKLILTESYLSLFDFLDEANFKRSLRQAASSNPDVAKKGKEGLMTSTEQQAVRGGDITPRELRLSQEKKDIGDIGSKLLMKKAVIFAADRARRERSGENSGRLKALRQFDKKPNDKSQS